MEEREGKGESKKEERQRGEREGGEDGETETERQREWVLNIKHLWVLGPVLEQVTGREDYRGRCRGESWGTDEIPLALVS